MPGKNTVKTYVANSYYHVYNRGVDKRKIFEDSQDVKVFIGYLKSYLSPPPDPSKLIKTITLQGVTFKGIPRQPKNFNNEIELLAYCLMPNHFHFLIKQNSKNAMEKFMRSLTTRYSMYFNKKYQRVGRLFQGSYKAVMIKDDSYLLHLSRYIHLNPLKYASDLKKAYSSYAEYLGIRKTSWIKPDVILTFFKSTTLPELEKVNKYDKFVEQSEKDSADILGDLTLDADL